MHRNWLLLSSMAILAGFSILTLRSVAPAVASDQLIFFVLGALVFWIITQIPLEWFVKWQWLAYVSLCLFLVLPLLIGTTTRGIKAWIEIGTWFSIQPSQLAIPIVALTIATFLQHKKMTNLVVVVKSLVLLLFPAVLILLEPDLGTTIVYVVSIFVILYLHQLPWKIMLNLLGIVLVAAVLSWHFVLKPYQKDRITSFMGADKTTDASYNARQSLIAVGSGQGLGRGLGQGVQSHLRFLPERQTDFVFASLAEEWGFLGSAVVMGAYATIIIWLLTVAARAKALWQSYFCYSLVVMMTVQTTINVGMNIGLLPITGITLPLLSYGGSSIIAICGSLGLAYSIAQQLPHKMTGHFS